jgi:cellulose synthase/poly-beta-1,6-N-acetylglucosamine synthase-like glycosyltransferase
MRLQDNSLPTTLVVAQMTEPTSTIAILLLMSLAYYATVQLGLVLGMGRTEYSRNRETPFVSIIVAARNEEASIGSLLERLLAQSYPHYEVIIVSDRSTDKTDRIVKTFQANDSRITLHRVDKLAGDLPAKKNALHRGIGVSKGELLVFTDADCQPSGRWLSELVEAFDPSVGAVAGYSPYDRSLLQMPNGAKLLPLLWLFVAYEELRGAIWACGSIGMNMAWLCTGRNFAYRRKVFDEVGGFEQIKMSVSGDDDLLLQTIRRTTGWKIRYVSSPQSFVRTAPPGHFHQFVEQRKRHFSAGKYFTPAMKAFFFFYHSANLILLLGLLATVLAPTLLHVALGAFLAKLLVDGIVMIAAGFKFGEISLAAKFLPMEILYIFYNSLIGPLGFITDFEWKPERHFDNHN